MEIFLQPESWLALLTLTLLEIVLGVDNIIFITIVTNKLPEQQQDKARLTGLALALIFRIALLFGISYIIHLTTPLFTVGGFEFSWRDLILSIGGLFLIAKSTSEINHKMEDSGRQNKAGSAQSFANAILQIILLDIIFSFDSILTAVGLTEVLLLMITAVVISMIVMMAFANKVARIISKNPSLEILALSFLILIGFMLMVDAFHYHVPKGYIYFAVFFSLFVQLLNIKVRKSTAKFASQNQLES
jgi:predicted tellurium resistance membrane protein TerC